MFSPLTSKVFAATTAVLAIAFLVDEVIDARKVDSLETTIAAKNDTIRDLNADLATVRLNSSTFEGALAQCSKDVRAAADQASLVAEAGRQAVEQVRRAGQQTTQAAIRRLEGMPTDGATPAELCAQADAIILEGAN